MSGIEKYVNKLVGSNSNVEWLSLPHLPTVLDCRESWVLTPDLQKWVLSFWEYVNTTMIFSSNESAAADRANEIRPLSKHPLLLCSQGETRGLLSINETYGAGYVVSSSFPDLVFLYSAFSDLAIIDYYTFPKTFRPAEESSYDFDTLRRFLQSLSLMAEKANQTIVEYCKPRIAPGAASVSCFLLFPYTSLEVSR